MGLKLTYQPGQKVVQMGIQLDPPGHWFSTVARGEPQLTYMISIAFPVGEGMGWHEHDHNVFVGCELRLVKRS